jgi:hypothetical protein
MSLANDFWNHEREWSSEWQGSPKPYSLLLPSTRFTLFALTAIVAGAALAFVT